MSRSGGTVLYSGQGSPAAAQQFTLGYRSTVTNQPVPTLRPVSANTQIALDVVPNGAPFDDGTAAGGGYGVAWADLCSSDIRDPGGAASTNCAHIAVSQYWAEFGSTSWGKGVNAAPIILTIADDSATPGTLVKTVVATFAVTGITMTTPTAGAAGLTLKNPDSGAGSYTQLKIGNDNVAVNNAIRTYSSGFVFEAGNPWRNALHVYSSSSNGLVLDASAGPIRLMTNGTSVANTRIQLDTSGNVALGTQSALAAAATNGFVYIRSGAGAPTGVPATAYTGLVPTYYDTTNHKFWIYDGGWKGVVLA